ncbi:MAG TPA: hypothetical protein VFZ00_09730 [Solirubrobacter sp.]|nr:hypothetical protein [Solirubrobacter sp.]
MIPLAIILDQRVVAGDVVALVLRGVGGTHREHDQPVVRVSRGDLADLIGALRSAVARERRRDCPRASKHKTCCGDKEQHRQTRGAEHGSL